MMMNNGVNFYGAPFASGPYPGIPNNFGVNSPSLSQYYNIPYPTQKQQQPLPPQPQQQQPEQHKQQQPQYAHRPKSQQNNENNNTFKLYDLNTSNHSDIIRLMFSFAGVPFKDKRLKPDEWNNIKEQIPFQQLPILRVNNQFKIFQLHAIVRYLAREFHLYGTGKHDHAIVDIILEIARQLQDKIFEQIENSPNYEAVLHQIIKEYSETYLQQFEELYAIFDRRGPFYLGSHISLADLIVYDIINYLTKIDTKLLENYPHLKDARRHLEKHPGISNFIKAKNNQSKAHRYRSPHQHRHRTKSPTPNANAQHHHHHHRHRSNDGNKSKHHHHHHYHCPYHHRHTSKEETPSTQTKQQSERSTKSPSITTNEKESVPIPIMKQSIPIPIIKQSILRSSKSPSSSRKDKEPTPLSHTKQRLIRTSISPSILKPDKTSTPTTTTADIIPPPPPIIKEHRSEPKPK